jgi:hypothetical protein
LSLIKKREVDNLPNYKITKVEESIRIDYVKIYSYDQNYLMQLKKLISLEIAISAIHQFFGCYFGVLFKCDIPICSEEAVLLYVDLSESNTLKLDKLNIQKKGH